jgi:hypothetical protein
MPGPLRTDPGSDWRRTEGGDETLNQGEQDQGQRGDPTGGDWGAYLRAKAPDRPGSAARAMAASALRVMVPEGGLVAVPAVKTRL